VRVRGALATGGWARADDCKIGAAHHRSIMLFSWERERKQRSRVLRTGSEGASGVTCRPLRSQSAHDA
jgi:hypothetical protein